MIGIGQMIRCFANNSRGTIAVLFGLIGPVLLLGSGLAIDVTNLFSQRHFLQSLADGAALTGAAELQLGNASNAVVLQVAQNYVKAAGRGAAITFTGAVSPDKTTLQVYLRETGHTFIMQAFNASPVNVGASATAKVVSGPPVCAVGLDPNANFTVGLDQQARVLAINCAVYSNSTNSSGLFATNSASLQAKFICSAGGKSGAGFSPMPQTDCPVQPDPLINRPAPPVGGCTYTNLVVKSVVTTLFPGTYCGGLTITNSANVILSPGTYVMQNGPLYVTGGASLTGITVGIFLTGSGAVLNFDAGSTIVLKAPILGDLAGLLVFEDRASPKGQTHQILSDNARVLLGTIYLPQGQLYVGANQPVADLSDYTIIVAGQIRASGGPTIVLNTNYNTTPIPIPLGLGPQPGRTVLTQ